MKLANVRLHAIVVRSSHPRAALWRVVDIDGFVLSVVDVDDESPAPVPTSLDVAMVQPATLSQLSRLPSLRGVA